MSLIFEVERNVGFDLYFPLFTVNGEELATGGVTANGDAMYSVDGGTFATNSNAIAEVATSSGWYKLAIVAAEVAGKMTMVKIVDQDATKVYMDQTITLLTGGDATAFYDSNRFSVNPDANVVRVAGTVVSHPIESNVIEIDSDAAVPTTQKDILQKAEIFIVQAGTRTTTSCPTDLASTKTDVYKGRRILWTTTSGGNLDGQPCFCRAYDGAGTLTYSEVIVAPAVGDKGYLI